MRAKKIKERLLPPEDYDKRLMLTGWLDGKDTYLWFAFASDGVCLGHYGGYELYRLCKAIVKEYESRR